MSDFNGVFALRFTVHHKPDSNRQYLLSEDLCVPRAHAARPQHANASPAPRAPHGSLTPSEGGAEEVRWKTAEKPTCETALGGRSAAEKSRKMKKAAPSGIARIASGKLKKGEAADSISPALKRSFEVEEVDTSAHSSPHARRTANTHLRTAISPPSQRFQDVGPRNSDYSPKLASEVANQRSPKTSLRRIELMGGRTPEPVSRRTEISIDISSKQVDSSPSPGIARFGLRRPDPQVHSKPPEAVHRRAEVSLGRPQEAPPPRRADPPSSVSRIPEPVHKKAEVPGSVDPVPRRPEAQVTKPLEAAVLSKAPENNIHATPSVPPSALLSYTEYKVPPPASEVYIRNSESDIRGEEYSR
ncbi:neuronal-specific septin-3-like isoform X1 [Arapaima gigas]